MTAREDKLHDPVKLGQKRCLCLWIMHPQDDRCPRKIRTGEPCWCRPKHEADGDWPWRVVPPLAGRNRPGWNYDDGLPLLLDDGWEERKDAEELSR